MITMLQAPQSGFCMIKCFLDKRLRAAPPEEDGKHSSGSGVVTKRLYLSSARHSSTADRSLALTASSSPTGPKVLSGVGVEATGKSSQVACRVVLLASGSLTLAASPPYMVEIQGMSRRPRTADSVPATRDLGEPVSAALSEWF